MKKKADMFVLHIMKRQFIQYILKLQNYQVIYIDKEQ